MSAPSHEFLFYVDPATFPNVAEGAKTIVTEWFIAEWKNIVAFTALVGGVLGLFLKHRR